MSGSNRTAGNVPAQNGRGVMAVRSAHPRIDLLTDMSVAV